MAPPLPINISTGQRLVDYLNVVSNNLFWNGALVSAFLIIFISLAFRLPKEDAFVTASFISLIIAIIMRAMNAVSNSIVMLFLALTIIATGLIYIRK